ncbi:MAG TPA: SMI1/KNR4 family protein [Actinoplanes sp.]|nr:SMI1/KNR4 family protein [Actinoplanes sp.]
MPDNEIATFERLRAAWRSQGAPVADHLNPGLDDAALDDAETSSGLLLPVEMRRWWGWHDGVRRRVAGTALGPESRVGAGSWDLLSLDEALRHRALMIQLTEEFEEEDEVFWRREWLPVVYYDGSYLFVTCGEPRTDHGEVRRWTRIPDDPDTVRAASWSEAVTVFADLLESGGHTYDPETERWEGPPRPHGDARIRGLL